MNDLQLKIEKQKFLVESLKHFEKFLERRQEEIHKLMCDDQGRFIMHGLGIAIEEVERKIKVAEHYINNKGNV